MLARRRRLLVCAFALLAGCGGSPESPSPPGTAKPGATAKGSPKGNVPGPRRGSAPGPRSTRVAFDRLEHDFGVAAQRATLKTEFTLTNGGQKPLVVRARGDCGCVVPGAPTSAIAPGTSTKMAVEFHTGGFVGPQTKHVDVTTDDPEVPMVTLRLTVDVSAGVLLAPANFTFPVGLLGNSPTARAVVKWKEGKGEPFRVTDVQLKGVDMTSETVEWTAPGEKGWEIVLRFASPPPIGQYSGTVTILTDAPTTPKLTAPVHGSVSGRVWIAQRLVRLAAPYGQGTTRKIPVRGFDATVDLGEVTAKSTKGIVTAKAMRDPALPTQWTVEIGLPTDAPVGVIDDVVEVRTAVPGEEVQRIEVGGNVMPKRTR